MVAKKKRQGTLLKRTIELWYNRPIHIRIATISKKTKLSEAWLKALPYRKDPSVNKVEKLYNYLSDTPLTFK